MPHLVLAFMLGERDADDVEAACLASGARAVTLVDARDDAVLEPAPGELRLWPQTHVQALFDGDGDAAQLSLQLAQALGLTPEGISVQRLEDRAWEREWLRDFHPRRFGRRLWVCPRHERCQQSDAVIVELDPGLAFGTGGHPSTALCLTWLDAAQLAGRRVIDYGCGSGILALAAAHLGAAEVFAFDLDPQALIATAENAAANGVAAAVRVCAAVEQVPTDADLLLANLLSRIHCELASHYATRLAPAGELLLSGILRGQEQEVMQACAPWFEITPVGEQDEWLALAGRRHGS